MYTHPSVTYAGRITSLTLGVTTINSVEHGLEGSQESAHPNGKDASNTNGGTGSPDDT